MGRENRNLRRWVSKGSKAPFGLVQGSKALVVVSGATA